MWTGTPTRLPIAFTVSLTASACALFVAYMRKCVESLLWPSLHRLRPACPSSKSTQLWGMRPVESPGPPRPCRARRRMTSHPFVRRRDCAPQPMAIKVKVRIGQVRYGVLLSCRGRAYSLLSSPIRRSRKAVVRLALAYKVHPVRPGHMSTGA